MAIGEHIKRIRQSKGLTLSELARRAGVSKSLISRVEAGAESLRVESVRAISDALEIPHGELLNLAETVTLPSTILSAAGAVEAAQTHTDTLAALVALYEAVNEVRRGYRGTPRRANRDA